MEARTLFFLILLVILYSRRSAHTSAAATYANETDRTALLSIKHQITGDPAGFLGSWNDTTQYCDWTGVSCSGRHPERVTALDLSSMDLSGPLSPAIGNLTFLRKILLPSNGFFGVIPSEIGRLRRLQQLNLSFNSFQGGLPANISRCAELRLLDLSNNPLGRTIPADLGSLPKLETLLLEADNLTGTIPASLGNLSSLAKFSLKSNKLEGAIPEELGKLSKLRLLRLSLNSLSGAIPLSLYNLSSVHLFSMSGNSLQGRLPASIGITLPRLNYLLLGSNQLTGSIPASISNASLLLDIDIPYNKFSGSVPPELGRLQALYRLNLEENQLQASHAGGWDFLDALTNCTNLQLLGLDNNNLGGSLPGSLTNLSTQLQELKMGGNQISGRIPEGIENLANLYSLTLNDNFLAGEIPESIGKLHNLQLLYVYNNNLSGEIPSSLGNLTGLNELVLLSNNFEGPIPSSLGKLEQLAILDLSNNNLSGTIPKEVVSLSSLSQFIFLSSNRLVGPLPIEVGRMKNARGLFASRNKLSGEIPVTLGDCQSLEQLVLDNNLFTGSIPPSLSNLKGLKEIDLSNNNLSGTIPEMLEDLRYLKFLNLSSNHLDGRVPSNGVFKNATATSLLGNDGLCGGIQDLHLPACDVETLKQQKKGSWLLKLLIPLAVFVLLVLSFAFFCWKRKVRKNLSSSIPFQDKYHRVSHAELAKATEGFSSTNLIGKGRYGLVYKGILDNGSTTVAVKVFNLEVVGATKSFIAECDALRSIRHRNLLKIITSCSSIDSKGNDFKALVFEFMPNGSLDAWLHPGAIDEQNNSTLSLLQRLNIAIDVADALDYLHHNCETPIVHCDLKPSNVLLDNDMSAHVGDFGLAKFLFESSNSGSVQGSLSSIGIRGSIGYVAPEHGEGGEVSTAGDVYSFGILLLELLTGKGPTDEEFKDGLTLHDFVKMAFPQNLMEIIDPLLLMPQNVSNARRSMEECLASMLGIGLSCSNRSPRDRSSMREISAEMHKIRDAYLGAAIQGGQPGRSFTSDRINGM